MGDHVFRGQIREEKQRHFAAIADKLFELDRVRPVRGIVLAAAGVDANSVARFLHPYLAGRLVGAVKLNPKNATATDILAATLEAREAQEREEEQAWLAEMREKLGTGWAVNGVWATLKALGQGKVRTLLVRPDATVAGFRARDTGRLVLTERESRLEGGAVPVLDVIDDAIEEALRQRVTVDVVYDPGSAEQVDGLAALLRFR